MSLAHVGRVGELRLTFRQQAGKTQLIENFARPPLQVMQPIPDSAGCLCVYVLSPSGGVVQDDRYHIHLTLEPHTHALLTTPSATRVYRMPHGHAEQHVTITVDRNAILEFVPEATILFADADFRQTIDVTLQPGALLLLQEIVMPGRVARGEFLQFRQYRNRLRVCDEQGLVMFDASQMQPAQTEWTQTGLLEGFACWGSFYVVGDLKHIDIEAFCRTHSEGLVATDTGIGALSPLQRGGFSVRVLSHRLETIYTVFAHLRQAIRSELGIAVEVLRK